MATPDVATPDVVTPDAERCEYDVADEFVPCDGGSVAVPNGEGGVACVAVGPEPVDASAPWPDVAGGRVVWVAVDGGGNGTTPEAPAGSIPAALDGGGAVTVALGRGVHRLSGPLVLANGQSIVGVGASSPGVVNGTTIELPSGAQVTASAGASMSVIGVHFRGARDAGLGAVQVGESGARFEVRGVIFEGVPVAVQNGATFVATSSAFYGAPSSPETLLTVSTEGQACLRAVVMDSPLDAAHVGVRAERSRLLIEASAIAHQTGGGVSLVGASSRPAPTSMACEATAVVDGGVRLPSYRIVNSAFLFNGLFGIYAASPGTIVDATDIRVVGTTSGPGRVGGEGIRVVDGARLLVDEQSSGGCGTHSRIEWSRGGGISVGASSTAVVKRALLVGNEPGVYVGESAAAFIDHNLFATNRVVGIYAMAPREFYGACNGIYGTLADALNLSVSGAPIFDGRPIGYGDGVLLVGESTGSMTRQIRQNQVSDNARFGVLVVDADASVEDNFGERNGYRGAVRIADGGVSTYPSNDIGGARDYTSDAAVEAGRLTVAPIDASACAVGLSRCGSACVDLMSAMTSCGACGVRCGAAQLCIGGACAALPAGDTADNPIALPGQPSFITTVNTEPYHHNAMVPCGCTSGDDVFYRFTVAADTAELFYADTIGSANDTSLFLQSAPASGTGVGTDLASSGLTNGATCNDDTGLTGCATGTQSQVLARLGPGNYYLVLTGCTAGAASLRVQRLPIGNGPATPLAPGMSTPGGTASGTGRINVQCGGNANAGAGPEDTYYWYTCPAFAGGIFTASTCRRALWNTVLDQRSAARAVVSTCNDNDPMCSPESTVRSVIPAGPGLHALYVDGTGVTPDAGVRTYTVQVTRP